MANLNPIPNAVNWPTLMVAAAFGAAGGMVPTLSKLAGTYVTAPHTPLPEWGLLLGLAIFAVIGAVVAIGFGQIQLREALIAGIAAPGIITNIVSGASDGRTTPPQVNPPTINLPASGTHNHLLPFSIISTANAQPAPSPSTSPASAPGNPKMITIDPRVSGGLPAGSKIPVEIQVLKEDGSVTKVPAGTIKTLGSPTTIVVPHNASTVTIGNQTVPADSKIQLNVVTKPSSGSDFFWALGGRRNYEIEHLQAK